MAGEYLFGELMKQEVHLEFSGNRQVIIEECKGILEYSEQQVRVNTSKYILRFQGKNLQISAMTHDSIILSGHIDRLEFLF